MAHPTSLPTTASSISTFESYCLAVSTALGSSSFRGTLLTPKDEPERAGLTKTGKVSWSASILAFAVTVQKLGVAIPALLATM
jgi:hypothetical protein